MCLGIIKNKKLILTPISQIFQFRHDFSNINKEKGLIIKTKGGKTAIINIADKKTYNKWHKNKKKKVDQALVKRTVTLKMKKGEVVFINVTAGYAGKGTTSFNLEIK